MKRLTLILGLSFIIVGEIGQGLHHYRVLFLDDSLGERFGAILVIGILIQLLVLIEEILYKISTIVLWIYNFCKYRFGRKQKH